MKEPSLQHGMSAEFEITNKTQKEIQHSISLLASMVSAREFELLSTSIDKQDATLLSSLTGITKKRVQEKLIEVQAKNSKEFKEETSRLNQTPSPKRQIDNLRSKDESSPQMENLSDNYDDHASSIESFGARRLLTHRAGEGSPPRRESPPLLIHSIKNMDKLPKIKSDPSPIQYEFKFSEVPTITRSKDISATPEQGRTSRSKEKVPVPIRVLRSHMSKPSGDMDHPPM